MDSNCLRPVNGTPTAGVFLKLAISAGVRFRFLDLLIPWIIRSKTLGSFSANGVNITALSLVTRIMIASSVGKISDETELGVVISTGSCGLNLVAMMKNERIRNAISTKGVISVSVLFFG